MQNVQYVLDHFENPLEKTTLYNFTASICIIIEVPEKAHLCDMVFSMSSYYTYNLNNSGILTFYIFSKLQYLRLHFLIQSFLCYEI